MLARERIGKHILNDENFMIESNLAKSSEYDWLQLMINKGYEIILYYLGTDDVDINKIRLNKRIKEGGHEVAESIIEHRYNIGLSYLKSKILIFKEAYIIDNSQELSTVMAVLNAGKILQKELDCPAWVTDVLYITQRLQG